MTNLPLSGKFTITACFKQKNPKLWKTLGFHTGIDFTGNNEIYSTCDGEVDTIAYSNSYGNYIIIREYNSNRYHYFCHLSEVKVIKSQKVNRETIIGIMGSTGNVTGKHLHYEIREGKIFTEKNLFNPAEYCGIPNEKGDYDSKNYQLKKDYLKYRVHVQNIGWQESKENGELAGTEGQSLRIEKIGIYSNVPLQFRVHIENKGWTDWYPQNCELGTEGEGLRLEAIHIVSQKDIKVSEHVQNIGWLPEKVGKEIMIGTEGKALRLEALKLEIL